VANKDNIAYIDVLFLLHLDRQAIQYLLSQDLPSDKMTLRNLVKPLTDLKETIVKQNTIIENNQTELLETKRSSKTLRVQNTAGSMPRALKTIMLFKFSPSIMLSMQG
jgi:hypothetical protein